MTQPTATAAPGRMSAGHVIVESLAAHGVERAYVVPGFVGLIPFEHREK